MWVMPGLRVTASCTVALLRARTSSPLMALVLAGVSRADRPRREPAGTGVSRRMAVSSAWPVTAVAGSARVPSSACREKEMDSASRPRAALAGALELRVRVMSFLSRQE